MEREVTLRDYGRVLWAGRWVLLAAAVLAAVIGLIVSLARDTKYTATSIVYLGLVTTPGTGQPVPTPLTTPLTAQKVLRGDRFVQAAADGAGLDDVERVRDGVTFTVDRIPGAAGGNQPVVATIRYRDRDRATAVKVANAYADGVLEYRNAQYQEVAGAYQTQVDDLRRRQGEIERSLDRLRGRGAGSEVAVFELQQELGTLLFNLNEASIDQAKTKAIEAPSIVSKAASASSSARPGQRLKTIVFAAILGLVVGAIATFVWRGSPAGRADA